MLNITYAPSEAALAEQLQNDLSSATFELQHHFLLVLVVPESSSEETVDKAIRDALAEGHKVVPLLVRPAPVPEPIQHMPVFNMTNGYKTPRLIQWLQDVDQEKRKAANKRAFVVLGVIVGVMFILSSLALGGGLVAFPDREFEEANAAEIATRDALIQPTLDVWQPRSTEEAANFPATVEAVGTRYRPFIVMTATAIAPANFDAPSE